jgi:23S rRNA pseudoU1915 N3-methylase RlmH
MHIRLIAVGDRQPQWVDEAFQNYSRRFPPQWKFRLDVIAAAKRKKAEDARRAIETEGELILGKLAGSEQDDCPGGRRTVATWRSSLVARTACPMIVGSGPILSGRCQT